MASIALTDTAQLRSSLQEARDQRAVIVAKIKDFKSKLDASQAELDAIDKTIPLYEELVRIKRESVDAPVRLVKAPVYKEDDSTLMMARRPMTNLLSGCVYRAME